MSFIKMVDVYKIDFFKKKAIVNLNNQLVEYPIPVIAANNLPGKVYQALLIGESKDSAIAIPFEPLNVTEKINQDVKNTQTNLMT